MTIRIQEKLSSESARAWVLMVEYALQHVLGKFKRAFFIRAQFVIVKFIFEFNVRLL